MPFLVEEQDDDLRHDTFEEVDHRGIADRLRGDPGVGKGGDLQDEDVGLGPARAPDFQQAVGELSDLDGLGLERPPDGDIIHTAEPHDRVGRDVESCTCRTYHNSCIVSSLGPGVETPSMPQSQGAVLESARNPTPASGQRVGSDGPDPTSPGLTEAGDSTEMGLIDISGLSTARRLMIPDRFPSLLAPSESPSIESASRLG